MTDQIHSLPLCVREALRKAVDLSTKNNIKVVAKCDDKIFVVITPEMTIEDAAIEYKKAKHIKYIQRSIKPRPSCILYLPPTGKKTWGTNDHNVYYGINMTLVPETIEKAINIAKRDQTSVIVLLGFDVILSVNDKTDLSKKISEYRQTMRLLNMASPKLRIRTCDLQR